MTREHRIRDFVKRHRQFLKIAATIIIAAVIFYILATRLRGLSVEEIVHSLDEIPAKNIVDAVILTVISYIWLATYEFIGLQYIHKFFPIRRVLFASFLTYTFNFNLGSIVGGLGMRFRLYRRWQLKHSEIVRLSFACIFTSWVGYVLLSGSTLVWMPEALSHFRFYNAAIARVAGVILLGIIAVLIIGSKRARVVHFGRWHITTFNRRQLVSALTVSVLQWLTLATIIYVFLSHFAPVDFSIVLLTYLFAAIASVLLHVPAGLGVLEGTFVLAFEGLMRPAEILASIFAFRTIYYFIPFAISLVTFSVDEIHHWRAKKRS